MEAKRRTSWKNYSYQWEYNLDFVDHSEFVKAFRSIWEGGLTLSCQMKNLITNQSKQCQIEHYCKWEIEYGLHERLIKLDTWSKSLYMILLSPDIFKKSLNDYKKLGK